MEGGQHVEEDPAEVPEDVAAEAQGLVDGLLEAWGAGGGGGGGGGPYVKGVEEDGVALVFCHVALCDRAAGPVELCLLAEEAAVHAQELERVLEAGLWLVVNPVDGLCQAHVRKATAPRYEAFNGSDWLHVVKNLSALCIFFLICFNSFLKR